MRFRFLVFNAPMIGLLSVAGGGWRVGLCVVAANVIGYIEGRTR